MKRQKQKDKLEDLVRDLESELSERDKQIEVIEETNKRLLEAERICQQLVEENRQLREELAGWQERAVKSEETRHQVQLLRRELEGLRAEHASVIEKNRDMQQKVGCGRDAGALGSAVEPDSSAAMTVESRPFDGAGAGSASIGPDRTRPDLQSNGPKDHAVQAIKASWQAWNALDRRWHFGAISVGVLVLVIAGTIIFKNPSSRPPTTWEPIEFTPAPPTPKTDLEPVPEPRRRVEPRIRGTFQTVRPTRVFSEPSEASAPVAEIPNGARVNVVDSTNGWLEIRSKHGRPPGFIRQESAVRINSN